MKATLAAWYAGDARHNIHLILKDLLSLTPPLAQQDGSFFIIHARAGIHLHPGGPD